MDSINFNYSTPGFVSLLGTAFNGLNFFGIKQLYLRGIKSISEDFNYGCARGLIFIIGSLRYDKDFTKAINFSQYHDNSVEFVSTEILKKIILSNQNILEYIQSSNHDIVDHINENILDFQSYLEVDSNKTLNDDVLSLAITQVPMYQDTNSKFIPQEICNDIERDINMIVYSEKALIFKIFVMKEVNILYKLYEAIAKKKYSLDITIDANSEIYFIKQFIKNHLVSKKILDNFLKILNKIFGEYGLFKKEKINDKLINLFQNGSFFLKQIYPDIYKQMSKIFNK